MIGRSCSWVGVGGWLAGVLVALLLTTPAHGTEPAAEKAVLLLYAESRVMPANASIDQEIRSLLQQSSGPVRFYTEHLDVSWFPDAGIQELLIDVLRQKYAGRRLDLVIAVGPGALRFALLHRATVFPDVPLVFTAGLPSIVDDLPLPPDVTGTWLLPDWKANLDLILSLHADTRRIALVYGTSAFDRSAIRGFHEAFSAYRDRLELVELTDVSFDEMLQRMAALPERTVVMFVAFFRDATGRAFVPAEVVGAVSRAARVPVYGVSDSFVGLGVIGGRVIDFQAQGRQAATLAARVLSGERPGPAAAGGRETNVYMFDARALKRRGVSERRLPPDSLVKHREASLWELYRWQIAAGVAVIAIQSALILGLLVQRRQSTAARLALARNLGFERLVSEISTTLATVAPAEIDGEIQQALLRIIQELGFDRGNLIEMTDDPRRVHVTRSMTARGVAPLPPTLEVAEFPWAFAALRRGELLWFLSPDEIPAEGAVDRASFLAAGITSFVGIPLDVGQVVVGAVTFATVRPAHEWPHVLIQRLRLVGEIFANALVRRRADAAVRESEARFAVIADAAPVMVWMAGTDGRCTYFNRGLLEFTGRSMGDDLADVWADRVHPEDRERCVAHYRRAQHAREEFVLEYRLRRHDGEYRWLADRGVPRLGRDGTFGGYVGTCTDISDIKAAHTATLKSVALRSAIFGSLYSQVAALDREGRVVAVNESWAHFGETGDGDPLRPSVGTDYLAACQRTAAEGHAAADQIAEAVRSVLDGRRQHVSLEYATRSDGNERWFDLHVEPFRHPDGGAIVSHLDITRRRLAEIEARRQREQLAHALRVTTLGELATSLAHEISQPLAAILSNAQAARLVLAKEPQHHDDLHGAVLDIAEDAKRAAQVIRRMRALLRKEWAERKYVDVNALVVEVANLLHADLEPKGVQRKLSLAKDVAPVLGDAIQLQQVLINVVMNASEAMVAASTRRALLTVETSRGPDGTVEITVSDNGPGVGEAKLEHIFEPFVTTKQTGLGMGLSISRSIVQAHGGRMWATPNDAGGLAVHIELPCEEEEVPR